MASLIERHRDQILGVLSCFDRVVIAEHYRVSATRKRWQRRSIAGIRLFDYATEFAEPFRESIRAHATHVAVVGLTLRNLFLVPEFAAAALAH
jgi:hypothetical protein